jgi:micrococcal nuclease
MEHTLYNYKAIVTSVYDGDTCTVDIDLGLSVWLRGEKLRLNRINAPELKGEERPKGLKSRDFLISKINGKEITIETIKDRKGKYGRYLAELWLEEKKGKSININDLLVTEGFAKYQKY